MTLWRECSASQEPVFLLEKVACVNRSVSHTHSRPARVDPSGRRADVFPQPGELSSRGAREEDGGDRGLEVDLGLRVVRVDERDEALGLERVDGLGRSGDVLGLQSGQELGPGDGAPVAPDTGQRDEVLDHPALLLVGDGLRVDQQLLEVVRLRGEALRLDRERAARDGGVGADQTDDVGAQRHAVEVRLLLARPELDQVVAQDVPLPATSRVGQHLAAVDRAAVQRVVLVLPGQAGVEGDVVAVAVHDADDGGDLALEAAGLGGLAELAAEFPLPVHELVGGRRVRRVAVDERLSRHG